LKTSLLGLAAWVWGILRHRYASLLFRMGVGITFVVAATAKIREGSAFVDEVLEYELLPEGLAEVYATVLPWVEVVVGCLLIVGLATRVGAVVAALVSLSLIIANGLVLARGLDLACGCFGDMAALETREAIIIDCVLLILSLLILVRRGDFISVDLWLRRRGLRKPAGE
jgi:uncharacterized membrane protein YphA (DoxX/SURF4 family)